MTHTPSSIHTRTHTRTFPTRTHTHTVGKAHTGRSPLAHALTLTLWAKPTRAQPPGFTLVEAAIIVIVIGIIAALVIPAITSRITTDRGAQGRGDVVSVRDEIIGFAMMEERLPVESPAGYIRDDADNLQRLPKAQAGDFWGQQFMYRVANNQVGDPLSNSHPVLCNATGTNLSVQRGGVTTENVAFIIKSNGPNMQDDVVDFTTANPVVVHATGTPVTIGAETLAFDDIVEFVTLDYLKGRACP